MIMAFPRFLMKAFRHCSRKDDNRDRRDVADEIQLRRWILFDIPASLLTVLE
jgi:hypothetical protein